MDDGMFRLSMMGFNKQDVLSYIDSLNDTHNDDMQRTHTLYVEMQKSCGELQKAYNDIVAASNAQDSVLAELSSKLIHAGDAIKNLEEDRDAFARKAEIAKETRDSYVRLKAQLEEALDNNRQLSAHTAGMEAEIASLKEQLGNESVTDAPIDSSVTEELTARVNELTEQREHLLAELEEFKRRADADAAVKSTAREQTDVRLRILEDENAQLRRRALLAEESLRQLEEKSASAETERKRYTAFIENVGEFIAELHTTGKNIVDGAFTRSNSCLCAVEDTLSLMSASIDEIRAGVDKARNDMSAQERAIGIRLSGIVRDLESAPTPPGGAENDSAGNVPDQNPVREIASDENQTAPGIIRVV